MQGTGAKASEGPARYTVWAEIASGGMATVHLGRLSSAHGFARTVAIKELHQTFAKNKDFVARFVDEARLVARIRHPNVMPTLDVISDDNGLRIVMEYVAGESLDRLLAAAKARGDKTPTRVACAIMVGALHGLHAAHEANNEFGEPLGIVHLDVSPQNILVGSDGVPRVLDFGLARASGKRAPSELAGKAGYMAPEQVSGGEVSPRTDVFAASIVLWEMLTGEYLFVADNQAATMQRVLAAPIPALIDKAPHTPTGLSDVLKKGLSREPSQRFSTARDMALALEKVHGLASASEVGTWVESTAGDALRERADLVKAMESRAARASGPPKGILAPRDMYADEAAANRNGSIVALQGTGSAMQPVGLGPGLSPPRGGPSGFDPGFGPGLAPPGPGSAMVPHREADGSVQWKPAPKPRPASRPQEPHSRSRRGAIVAAGAVVALGLILVVLRLFVLPSYVRDAAIASAASQGVELTIDDAEVDGTAVVLRGLTAKLSGVPQITAKIASATAVVSWSAPAKAKLGAVDIAVDGDARATIAALGAWFEAHHTAPVAAAGAARATFIEMPVAHLVWTAPFGANVTRIELKNLQGTVAPSASERTGDEFHVFSSSATFDSPNGRFGPWNFDLEQSVTGRRVRVAFDPAVVDGASATLFQDAHAGTTFDLDIPHIPTGRLGLPPAPLGMGHPLPSQIGCKVHYSHPSGAGVVASLDTALFGVHIPGLPSSADAHISGDISGPPGGALAIKNGVASVGPLRAVLTGTVTLRDGGGSTSLSWKADPEPCASLAVFPSASSAVKDMADQALNGGAADLGSLVRDLGGLAEAAGAVTLTGTFTASGTAALDTADLAHPSFTVAAKNTCGLALFQGK